MESKVQFNFKLPPELVKRVKIRAIEEERNPGDLIAEAIASYLGRRNKRSEYASASKAETAAG